MAGLESLGSPETLQKARIARAAKTAARRASTLRQDFDEADWWLELASKAGLRLPAWGEPLTPTIIRTWCRKVKIAVKDYLEWAGESTVQDFHKANPEWPARAWCGLLLERFMS